MAQTCRAVQGGEVMEIQLHGRLVTCTPEEYKRLIELNLIEVPIVQSSGVNVDKESVEDQFRNWMNKPK